MSAYYNGVNYYQIENYENNTMVIRKRHRVLTVHHDGRHTSFGRSTTKSAGRRRAFEPRLRPQDDQNVRPFIYNIHYLSEGIKKILFFLRPVLRPYVRPRGNRPNSSPPSPLPPKSPPKTAPPKKIFIFRKKILAFPKNPW